MNSAEGDTRIGNIRPSVDLRESLEEIEKCKSFFEQGGFMEYLHSVNQCYLEDQGKIVGPEPEIEDLFDDNEESEMLGLSERSWGGIRAYLEHEQTFTSEPRVAKRLISISLRYGSDWEYFQLVLFASQGEKSTEGSPLLNGRFKQKRFWLNSLNRSNQSMKQDVENLLLTFTGEVLGAKIL